MVKYYTFSVLGKDENTYYPKEFSWKQENIKPGTGLLDFEWTKNIDEAKLWTDKAICDSIAFEYIDAKVIEITKE